MAHFFRSYEDAREVLPTGLDESERAPLADGLANIGSSDAAAGAAAGTAAATSLVNVDGADTYLYGCYVFGETTPQLAQNFAYRRLKIDSDGEHTVARYAHHVSMHAEGSGAASGRRARISQDRSPPSSRAGRPPMSRARLAR